MKCESNLITDQSRRDFFSTLALAGSALAISPWLSACDKTKRFAGQGMVPFKVWEEMLLALKTSPDNLKNRMKRLIADNDPEAMYHFVKDEIMLIPTNKFNLSQMDRSLKWGQKGVLRCGMATPREKAELLNYMFQNAGIESKVVYERTNIKPDEVPEFFFRGVTREFKPLISQQQLRSWKKEMGISDAIGNFEINKDYQQEAETLSQSVLKWIDQQFHYARQFDFRWGNNNTPTVEFTQEGEKKYAHLFDPKVPYGLLKNDNGGRVVEAKPVLDNEEKIQMEISYRTGIDYKKEIELLQGTWKASELVGKQVILNFLHGLSLEEQTYTSLGSVQTITPSLALQAIDEEEAYMAERSFIGDPFTIDGKQIQWNSEGKAVVDGNIINTKRNPALQKEVHQLSVKTSIGGNPIIKINVFAKDAEGKFIEGLSANDFAITEDDKPVKTLLENNQRTPKILVLADASMSMPIEYYAEGMDKFTNELTSKILESFPAAIIKIWKTPSSLFTWLLKASQTNYDLIIYATDGHNNDKFEERNRAIYEAGPPAIILNVTNSTWKTYVESFNKMAEITSGKVFDAKNQAATLREITQYINNMDVPPYVFSFGTSGGIEPHKVKVAIDQNRVTGQDTYQLPSTITRKNNGIIGIYLKIQVGKNKPVRRVLAGWDPINYTLDEEVNYSENVLGLLFGGAVMSIEGEGPTLSSALSDLLKSKLSNRSWGEAYLNGDFDLAKQEFEKGYMTIPSSLITLMAPLQNPVTEESLTFPAGYRIGIFKTLLGFDDKPIRHSFDYLPTSDYVTLAGDKSKAFTINLTKTAQLAVRENFLFQESSLSQLHNSDLIERSIAQKEKWRNAADIKQLIANDRFWSEIILRGDQYYKVFDRKAQSRAFWKIDQYTGEMYGILYDGSGGGANQYEAHLNKLSQVINMYMTLIAIMGQAGSMAGATLVSPLGGLSLGIVAKYGITLVKLYAIASEAIHIMDTSGMDEQIKKAMQILACEVAKEITYGLSGQPGQIMAGLDNLIGLMVGDEKNPFACK